MSEIDQEIPSRDRVNAAISYFFIGPLIAFAGNNPAFNTLFIQSHAKRATKWLLMGIFVFLFHFFWTSTFTGFFIPIINIRLDNLITFVIFLVYFLSIILGSYQASQGKSADTKLFERSISEGTAFDMTLSEGEKIRTIAAFIPVVGLFVKNPNSLGMLGNRVSHWFSITFIIILALGLSEAFQVFCVLMYTVFVVAFGVFLFLNKQLPMLRFAEYLPSKEAVQATLYTIPEYILHVFQAIVGKRSDLNFSLEYEQKLSKELRFESTMATVFTEKNTPFPGYLAYVPGVNLVHLGTFFSPGKSEYIVAVGQGMVIFISLCVGIYLYGEYDPILLLPFYAAIVGISQVKIRPFFKLPFFYEVYGCISLLSFGFLRKAGDAKAKNTERFESIVIDETTK